MDITTIKVGEEVAIGGYDTWLLVERVDGARMRVCHTFGLTGRHSAGFWIDATAVRESRPAPLH